MTLPLIDGDILLYEIGFCGEYKDEMNEPRVREFDFVADKFDERITEICEAVMNTSRPRIFFSLNEDLLPIWNRLNKEQTEFKKNFRLDVATSKVYKGQRSKSKPFHYKNIFAYAISKYDCFVSNGIEADDLISVCYNQLKHADYNPIICSRDKDLKITPGWHYGWPCGKQETFGPVYIDELGYIEFYKGKLVGGGLKLFYSQILTGDTTDNYGGAKGIGPKKALGIIDSCHNEQELFQVCKNKYIEIYGTDWWDRMNEQAQLAWMIQELDENQNPIHYEMLEGKDEVIQKES